MRSRSTTGCRSSGLARLGLAAAGLAVVGVTGSAAGQEDQPAYPPMQWVATESVHQHPNADDEAVVIGHWREDFTKEWVFAAGWITELDEEDEVVGTRMAIYKYDATDEGPSAPTREAVAFFPPRSGPTAVELLPGDNYKAVDMVVNYLNGNVFVVGEGPSEPGGSNQDYILIKYNNHLNPVWLGDNGARYYDGPVSGDDIPADLVVDPDFKWVVVTGSSPGSASGLDIATIAWEHDGDLAADVWPDVGYGDGVRRYDYDDGDDRAVELGRIIIAEESESNQLFIDITVLGTSWGGATTKDDYTIHYWDGSESGMNPSPSATVRGTEGQSPSMAPPTNLGTVAKNPILSAPLWARPPIACSR